MYTLYLYVYSSCISIVEEGICKLLKGVTRLGLSALRGDVKQHCKANKTEPTQDAACGLP